MIDKPITPESILAEAFPSVDMVLWYREVRCRASWRTFARRDETLAVIRERYCKGSPQDWVKTSLLGEGHKTSAYEWVERPKGVNPNDEERRR